MIGILAAEGPNGNFIPGDINEFYWGSLAFGIILGIFLWKGVPAISRLMKARTVRIEEELAAAAAQRSAAEADLATLSGQLGHAKLEADLLARAEADVADAKERSRLEIQAQREQALNDLRAAVAAQARVAADAVVRQNLDDAATQSALIDDYIRQLAG